MSTAMEGTADQAAPLAAASMSSSPKVSYVEERKLNSPAQVKISREARSKKGLKAEVKLTTAFVKKVATITDDSAAGLIKDVNEKLNLTRFVEEIVSSLAKAPLKLKDVEGATALCSAMHRSYEGFMELLFPSLMEQYDQACKSEDKAEVARRRVLLRWFAELYMVGLLEHIDAQVIVKVVRQVTRAGSPPGPLPDPLPETFPPLPDQACTNLAAVTTLLKALGNEFLDSGDDFPPQAIKSKLIGLFTAYVKGCLSRLKEERNALKRIRRRADNESLKRGEVSQETSEALERREKICEELYQGTVVLCEIMNIPKPPSPEEVREEEESQKEAGEQAIAEKVGLELLTKRKGADAELSFEAWIFGDEATRSFYEDLDDLVLVIPRMILERPDQALQPSVIQRLKGEKPADETSIEEKKEETSGEAEPENAEMDEVENNPDAIQDDDEETEEGGSKMKVETVTRPVEELMARLPDMLTVRAVESFARDFAHLNSKSARRRLVQELYQVPWGRTELLPFYARLTAILAKTYTGIGKALSDSVRAAYFRATRNRRPGSRLGSRLRYAKYLGELVKFGIKCTELECPPAAAFRALRQTMDFFQGENIDMACALVEACGRELYRTPRTHSEFQKLLEALQRNRTVRMLGPVYDAMVDNAYYHCIPVDANSASALARKVRRERTQIEKYVRYLLIDKLGESEVNNTTPATKPQQKASSSNRQNSSVDLAVASVLRLPWNESYEECEEAIARALLASCKHRAGTIPLVCQVVAQVAKRYPRLGARVVDDLIETITLGIERNQFRHNQRRIGQAKCLAHMLRIGLITQAMFFDALFMILHRGHEKPPGFVQGAVDEQKHIPSCSFSQAHLYHPAVPCSTDPPWDAFRIRLVCAALEAVGDKLTTPAAQSRLDVFVKYIERYVWNKSYVPIEVEFCLLDTLQDLERRIGDGVTKKRRFPRGKKGQSKSQPPTLQLVGRAPTRQEAEDQVSSLEGRGFQSVLTVSTVIEEEDEAEDDDEMDEENEEEAEAEEEEEVDDMDLEETKKPEPISKPEVPLRKQVHEPTPEDLAFEAEFAKLMKDTIEQSGKSNLGGAAIRGDNLVIPLNVIKKAPQPPSKPSGEESSSAPTGGVTLQLLKRGANRKVEVRALVVPDDSLLAKAQEGSRREMLEKKEDEEIKRLTLKAASATTNRLREEGGL